MKRKFVKNSCIIIAVVLALLLFTPLNISQFRLNAAQRESLCAALVDIDPDDWGDYSYKNSAVVYSVDIFGISGFGDVLTVYGYLDEGLYVEANGKAYEESGGLFEFMVDIRLDGDKVTIVKSYGDGVSTMSTLENMPFRYRCKWDIYTMLTLDRLLLSRTQNKVKDVLGVPIDRVNCLYIDDERGTYEIYDIDEYGNTTVEHRGGLDEL